MVRVEVGATRSGVNVSITAVEAETEVSIGAGGIWEEAGAQEHVTTTASGPTIQAKKRDLIGLLENNL